MRCPLAFDYFGPSAAAVANKLVRSAFVVSDQQTLSGKDIHSAGEFIIMVRTQVDCHVSSVPSPTYTHMFGPSSSLESVANSMLSFRIRQRRMAEEFSRFSGIYAPILG